MDERVSAVKEGWHLDPFAGRAGWRRWLLLFLVLGFFSILYYLIVRESARRRV